MEQTSETLECVGEVGWMRQRQKKKENYRPVLSEYEADVPHLNSHCSFQTQPKLKHSSFRPYPLLLSVSVLVKICKEKVTDSTCISI